MKKRKLENRLFLAFTGTVFIVLMCVLLIS